MMDIVITTFSKRFELLKSLIIGLRGQCENNIIITVNGEQNGNFNDEYRSNLLKLSSEITNVYPIFFLETRGLSKLWNTGVIHSCSENVIVLNDDVIVHGNFINECESFITSTEYNGLCMINGGFSYYIINKQTLDELNYFDERFIGFGWEDGDFAQRFILKTGVKSSVLQTSQIYNTSSDEIHENIPTTWGKYSIYNRDFARAKFDNFDQHYFNWGSFNFETQNQYPYETHFRLEKHKLYIPL